MDIYWIGPYMPVPDRSGADLRSFYLLRELKRNGARIWGSFLGRHGSDSESFFERHEVIESNAVMKYVRAGLGGVLGVPFNYGRYFDPALDLDVPSGAIVYVDHLHMTVNKPAHGERPFWLDDHNLEYELWEEYCQRRGGLLKPILRWEARRIKVYECDQIYASSGTALPSEHQVLQLPETIRDRVHVIPNGVPEEWLREGERRLAESPGRLRRLGFVGSYKWLPNRRGIEQFLNSVWPAFRTEVPELELLLAGADAPSNWDRKEGVRVLGYVDSTRSFFDQIDALVVPLEIGSGTRLKILEAFARGVPVISTLKGAEGLELSDQTTLLEAPEISALNEPLRKALESPSVLDEQRQAGHRQVREHYTWDQIGARLFRKLKTLV